MMKLDEAIDYLNCILFKLKAIGYTNGDLLDALETVLKDVEKNGTD